MQKVVIAALGTLLLAGVAAAPLNAAAEGAKASAKSAAAWKPTKNAFGQPDLAGTWSNATLTPMTRRPQFKSQLNYTPEQVKEMESNAAAEVEEGNEDTDPNAPAEAPKTPPGANIRPEFAAAGGDVGGYNRGWLDPGSHVMRVNGEPRTSLITTPDGQVPPRKAGAPPAPRFGGGMNSFDGPEVRSLGERCIMSFGRNAGPPMFPNGFYNNNYQIVQTADAVVIQVEMNHDLRQIRLNSKHRPDGVRTYMGDSIGWYEGDTLVVETINLPQNQNFMGSWKNLKITEKFTRVGEHRLHYQFTVEDPDTWDKPWGGEYEFSPLQGVIYEYACHEGNYALPGILGGARAEEAAKAEAAQKAAAEKAEADKAATAKSPGKKGAAARSGE
ncbi:MAG: hypothetical protein EPO51_01545 [Phenylobacterium sp.]|uniref:hypothetical protein n=1 Tax=Phenylobacterium sp. TaxID=1871053 RepID=UPI00120EEBF1|nr:hypothetical protein [Phenylobacterium sp.]TAJ74770.1 MAG: hypothetical protein EPO51_01545 [Phenylobacterium sp.]